jgi:hypothetical protein
MAISPRAFGGASAKPNPFKEESKVQNNANLLDMGEDISDDDENAFPDDIFSEAGI